MWNRGQPGSWPLPAPQIPEVHPGVIPMVHQLMNQAREHGLFPPQFDDRMPEEPPRFHEWNGNRGGPRHDHHYPGWRAEPRHHDRFANGILLLVSCSVP